MKAQRLATESETMYAVMFEKGDDPIQGIAAFARGEYLTATHFTGIGAFSDLVVGYFDRDRKHYRRIAINEQVEVLSLAGDIAVDEQEQPQVHAHVVVGKADGSAHGGHLLEAHIWPTLEVILIQPPAQTPRPGNPPRPDRARALMPVSARRE